MKKISIPQFLLGITLLSPILCHGSTVLSSNLSATSGGVEIASSSGWSALAADFSTGSSAYSLNNVALLLSGSGTATVALYSDGGYEPGSLLATLTGSASLTGSLNSLTFTSSGYSLAAGTTYWVVVTPASGSTVSWSWTSGTTGSGDGFSGDWSTSDGSVWYSSSTYPLQMAVNATALAGTAVPEPASAGIAVCAGLSLWLARKVRK